MGGKQISDFLINFGLKKCEVRIYLFLLENGLTKATTVSKALGLYREQVYRALDEMQKKGVVDVSLESPIRFQAVPFEELFSQRENYLRETLKQMESKKENLLQSLKVNGEKNTSHLFWKIRVVEGETRVRQELSELKNRTEKELCAMAPCDTFFVYERSGGLEDLALKGRMHMYRYLLLMNRRLSENEKEVLSKLCKHEKFEIRCCKRQFGADLFPCFAVRDGIESYLLTSSSEFQNATAICTNNRVFSALLQQLFENEWNTARCIRNTSKLNYQHRLSEQRDASSG